MSESPTKPTVTKPYMIKNKIRLHLRKTRQRVIKNLKRDISKLKETPDIEQTKQLLESVKTANIETVLKFVMSDQGNSKSTGEEKIGLVFLKSEQKALLDELQQNLESFRGNRTKDREVKPKKVKRSAQV